MKDKVAELAGGVKDGVKAVGQVSDIVTSDDH